MAASFHGQNLCPVKFADAVGLIVVMERAAQPVRAAEIEASDSDDYPDIDVEYKPEDRDGCMVALPPPTMASGKLRT
jgi:hypothetical protein